MENRDTYTMLLFSEFAEKEVTRQFRFRMTDTHTHTHNHHVNAQLVEYVNYECSFVNLLVNFLDHSVADSSIYVHCVYGEIRSEIQLSGIKNKRNPTSIHFVEPQHTKKIQREYRKKRKSAAVEFRAILCADFLVKSLKTVNNLFVRSN